ncbi:hypothetical protein ACFL2H_13585, partial [Planctomycetota bacterium]
MRSFFKIVAVMFVASHLASSGNAFAQEDGTKDQPAAEIDTDNAIDVETNINEEVNDEPREEAVESDKGRVGVPIAKPPRKQLTAKRVALIRFEGEIKPMSEQYLYRKLDEAKKENVELVVIEITSPGGRLDVLYRMAERIRDIEWASTVAYVPSEALSAAALSASLG